MAGSFLPNLSRIVKATDYLEPSQAVSEALELIISLIDPNTNNPEASSDLLREWVLRILVEGLSLEEFKNRYPGCFYLQEAGSISWLLKLADRVVGLERELAETRLAVSDSVDAIRDALNTEVSAVEIGRQLTFLENSCGESSTR